MDPLLNHQVSLTLAGSFKWESPPQMPAPGTVPNFVPLANDDIITIKFEGQEIYVLEWILNTTAPDIAASRSIYTLLSPDGATPQERLHHASLYTEAWLGVPEPGPASILALLAGLAGLIRRRR